MCIDNYKPMDAWNAIALSTKYNCTSTLIARLNEIPLWNDKTAYYNHAQEIEILQIILENS